MLAPTELRMLVEDCAEQVRLLESRNQDQIRTLQNDMWKRIPLEQVSLALTYFDAILGRAKIFHMTENNNFSHVGIVNTGQMSGTITANSQHVQINESANELFTAFAHFKRDLAGLPSLAPEDQEDALGAVSELEEQAAIPANSRVMSKVRNAVAALRTLASGTAAIHDLYEEVHPLLLAYFHLSP